MLDRFSSRSEIALLLLRTTISLPMSCKYRTSVPFERRFQSFQETTMLESTMVVCQRHETLPNRSAHGDIQHISKNWVTLWTWRIRNNGLLPLPRENEDKSAKNQWIEHRGVKHDGKGNKGRVQRYRAGSYISWPLRTTAIAIGADGSEVLL